MTNTSSKKTSRRLVTLAVVITVAGCSGTSATSSSSTTAAPTTSVAVTESGSVPPSTDSRGDAVTLEEVMARLPGDLQPGRADMLSVLTVDSTGAVQMPSMWVPISGYLSPEGQQWMADHLRQNQDSEAQVRVDDNPVFLDQYLDRMNALYPTTRDDTTIGGVHVYDYLPADGVSARNENRVLIELHPGAGHECWPRCAELQSIPIASVGKLRVVAVDYRLEPENPHPAQVEDITAVYKALLETYPPENVGIFGCSAGGQLTEQAEAWIQKQGLPNPGALGIYCANDNMNVSGDGSYTAAPLGEGWPPGVFDAFGGAEPQADGKRHGPILNDEDLYDPTVTPGAFDDVMSSFPPTQIITGTRFFDLSAQLYRHRRLVNLGVETELHVFEGLFHYFFMNPDLQESQDAYDVIVEFFDTYLSTSGK